MDVLTEQLTSLLQPFTLVEAAKIGVTQRRVRTARDADLVTCLAKGLYAVRAHWESQSPWDRHLHLTEAATRLTPDAIVSHASAAALHGWPHPAHPPEKVSMTVLDDVRTSRRDAWRQFHRGSTPAEHVVIQGGRPGLIPARTVLDSARELPGRDALAIADGALRDRLVTLDELLEMRRHQRRWPFVAASNDVLMLVDPRRENWLESASAWSMARWSLPVGFPQANVYTPDGEFLGRPDLLWEEHGIVGEADGVGKYLLEGATNEAVTRALDRERHRESGMTQAGLVVVRWTPKEAVDGAAIHTGFQRLADPTRGARARVVYRCSCCDHPLKECRVEAVLMRWRRTLTREFERTIW